MGVHDLICSVWLVAAPMSVPWQQMLFPCTQGFHMIVHAVKTCSGGLHGLSLRARLMPLQGSTRVS